MKTLKRRRKHETPFAATIKPNEARFEKRLNWVPRLLYLLKMSFSDLLSTSEASGVLERQF